MNQKVEVITSDFEKLKAFLQPLLKDAVREVLQEREEQDLMLIIPSLLYVFVALLLHLK